MIQSINGLAQAVFPDDGGIGAAEPVGPVDFLAQGGDIANRMEFEDGRQIQSAAASFGQFRADYLEGLTLTTAAGSRTPVFMVPGNHDVSNAIGFYRPMTPAVDPTSFVEIFNRVMAPEVPKTAASFNYADDRVNYSREVGGLHFLFINIWPDSQERRWMEQDLARVASDTPVVVVAHDQIEGEGKHFTNPKGAHAITATERFENLLADQFADDDIGAPGLPEQRALEAFLRRHPNITAYFHGNSNWNQFYDYVGPDRSVVVHAVRVDSPMKGRFSNADETRLSYQIATIDSVTRLMTVREVLWNTARAAGTPVWGSSTTVALSPRPQRLLRSSAGD